jgi:hypothetical protein
VAVPRTYDSWDPDPPGAWDPARIASRTGGASFDARDARLASRIAAHLAARRAAGQ